LRLHFTAISQPINDFRFVAHEQNGDCMLPKLQNFESFFIRQTQSRFCDARPIVGIFPGAIFLILREGYPMTDLCSKCGAHLSSPWRFCPLCGAEIQSQSQSEITAQESPSITEKTPARSVFGGLLLGVVVTPMCIIVGTMLCLTGLGAFLGVPMIIGGVLAPLLGPMIVIGEPKGKCPWCGTRVSNVFNVSSFDCHECGKRIDSQNRHFIKAA
jgi:predicted RNA-binding Zn-ribbon protein involved in translation (DUF1610 family)